MPNKSPFKRAEVIIIAVVIVFLIAVIWPKGSPPQGGPTPSTAPTDTAPATPGATPSATPSPEATEKPVAKAVKMDNDITKFATCDGVLQTLQTTALEHVADTSFPWSLFGNGPVYFEAAMARDGNLSVKEANADMAVPEAKGESNFSKTNTQEVGIDEPSTVKTNGKVIVSIDSNKNLIRVTDPDDLSDIATIKAVSFPGITELSDGFGSSSLLLDDNTLYVITEYYSNNAGKMRFGGAPRSVVTRIDLSDTKNPVATGHIRLSGSVKTGRIIGDQLKLVVQGAPQGLTFEVPESGTLSAEHDAIEKNRLLIGKSTLKDWLTEIEYLNAKGKSQGEPAVLNDCNATYAPDKLETVQSTAVVAINVDSPDLKVASTATMFGRSDQIYASADRIIVLANEMPMDQEPRPIKTTTLKDVKAPEDKFIGTTKFFSFTANDPEGTKLVGSGEVPGSVENQFNVDEENGITRISSWVASHNQSNSRSSKPYTMVSVFKETDKNIALMSYIDNIGVGDVTGGVRWLTPKLGAVVTYERKDPLFLIDTSNPAQPFIAGELEIPGYSAYLHPIDDDKLLGFGQDMDEETGQTLGFKVSLFDIADTSHPDEINSLVYTGSSSELEYDHTGLTYFNDTLFVPITGSYNVKRPINIREDGPIISNDDIEQTPFDEAVEESKSSDSTDKKKDEDTKGKKSDKDKSKGDKSGEKSRDDRDDVVVDDEEISISNHAQLLALSTKNGRVSEAGTLKFSDKFEIYGLRSLAIGEHVYAINNSGIAKARIKDMKAVKAVLFE